MSKRITVVFYSEGLYTGLKVEAARRHKSASDIIAEAVQEWLESREDAGLLPVIEAPRQELSILAGDPGFEPGLTDPESAVLPLD